MSQTASSQARKDLAKNTGHFFRDMTQLRLILLMFQSSSVAQVLVPTRGQSLPAIGEEFFFESSWKMSCTSIKKIEDRSLTHTLHSTCHRQKKRFRQGETLESDTSPGRTALQSSNVYTFSATWKRTVFHRKAMRIR